MWRIFYALGNSRHSYEAYEQPAMFEAGIDSADAVKGYCLLIGFTMCQVSSEIRSPFQSLEAGEAIPVAANGRSGDQRQRTLARRQRSRVEIPRERSALPRLVRRLRRRPKIAIALTGHPRLNTSFAIHRVHSRAPVLDRQSCSRPLRHRHRARGRSLPRLDILHRLRGHARRREVHPRTRS